MPLIGRDDQLNPFFFLSGSLLSVRAAVLLAAGVAGCLAGVRFLNR
jgi:hypothetical protein